MKLSELAHIRDLHHAYIVVGNSGKGVPEVLAMLETRGVKTAGNPDVLTLSFVELSIDDARTIASFASLKALGEEKYVVVSWSRATTEAQNALLKVVEEAPGNTVFFFSVDALGHTIATLQSRATEVFVSDGEMISHDSEVAKDVTDFLRASFEERLKKVDAIAAAITKTQDRTYARAFVRELLTRVHEIGASPQVLRDLLDAERYMRVQGGSVKAIVGHLAVTLPRIRS